VASNGNLYFFTSRKDGIGKCDIYVSKFINGRYLPPVSLSKAVNSTQNDWDAYVAPDERYIIFSSQNRSDTLGDQDLYISFRKQNGEWTQSRNMGKRVNSESSEICPVVTLDGKYLFFTSRRRNNSDIYWVDAKIIVDLKPEELN
jgi:Tol biopolymer transport system component